MEIRQMQAQVELLLERSFPIFTFLKEQCGNDPNFSVNQIVRNWMRYTFHRGGIECEMCEDVGQSVGYCVDCCLFIDEQCILFHKKIKSLMEHTILEYKRQDGILRIQDLVTVSRCGIERHGKAEHDSYCVKCKILLCKRCLRHHSKRGHQYNSLKDLYLLLDEVYSTKILIESILSELPKSQEFDNLTIILSTIVKWTEKTLKVQSDHADISEVELPDLVSMLLRRSGCLPLNAHTIYVSCKAVLEKMRPIKENLYDIRNMIGFVDSPNAEISGSPSLLFTHAPYRMEGDTSDCDGSYSSSSSDDSSRSNLQENQNTPSTYTSCPLSALTETCSSFNSEELFLVGGETNVTSDEPEE